VTGRLGRRCETNQTWLIEMVQERKDTGGGVEPGRVRLLPAKRGHVEPERFAVIAVDQDEAVAGKDGDAVVLPALFLGEQFVGRTAAGKIQRCHQLVQVAHLTAARIVHRLLPG